MRSIHSFYKYRLLYLRSVSRHACEVDIIRSRVIESWKDIDVDLYNASSDDVANLYAMSRT